MHCRGCVIAIGGAEDKIKRRAILKHFVKTAGAAEARLVILPAASTMPQQRGEPYAGIFNELGAPGEVAELLRHGLVDVGCAVERIAVVPTRRRRSNSRSISRSPEIWSSTSPTRSSAPRNFSNTTGAVERVSPPTRSRKEPTAENTRRQ